MLTASVPSDVIPLNVKEAVVLPCNTLTELTAAPAIPDRARVFVVTDAGEIGWLKVTFRVTGDAVVRMPPAGGLVEATASCA